MTRTRRTKEQIAADALKAAEDQKTSEPAQQQEGVGTAKARGVSMNDYALRVLSNISSSVSDTEKVGRIKYALKKQGWTDFSSLKLPIPNFDKWL